VKNSVINRRATVKVAKSLGDLLDEVVFVGGAMVGLYIDDPLAEDVRPTKDIDLTFQIATAGQLERIRTAMIQKGFLQTADSKVTCRFKYDDLLVDVMSTREVGWAPGNRWFFHGFDRAVPVDLEDVEIMILPLPYFLAAKFEAFFDRGIKDVYASKDLEDLVYLFNHTSDIVRQVGSSTGDLRVYLGEAVSRLMNDHATMAALPGHLFYENAEERYREIKQKFDEVVQILRT